MTPLNCRARELLHGSQVVACPSGWLFNMSLGHFLIPALSTMHGSLSFGVAGWGAGTGGLCCTEDAWGVSVSNAASSFLITDELLLILTPLLAFWQRGEKGSGTSISDGSAVLPAQAARLSWEDLAISLCVLWFWVNASSNEGFTLLNALVTGAGGGFTASVKDESSSQGLDSTFSFFLEQLCCVAVEGR